jgi:hypothetical protein
MGRNVHEPIGRFLVQLGSWVSRVRRDTNLHVQEDSTSTLGNPIELYCRAPLIEKFDDIIFVFLVQKTKDIVKVATIV